MEAIKNRLLKNLKHRRKWAKRNTIEAYRLYEKDIPEYPYVVDLYKNKIVIYYKGNIEIDQGKQSHREHLFEALTEIFEVTRADLIYKERVIQKGEQQYEVLDRKKKTFLIREHQALLLINLHDYLDTGLFLDHRPIRQRIFQEAKDKKFLNLFSYTGSVSVFAALGGAQTTSVDLSNTYQDWAKKNFLENNLILSEHEFITESALKFLERDKRLYDLIFLDPPTFSSSKKMDNTFEVERDQIALIKMTMKRLKKDGKLYFSNNKRTFKIAPILTDIFKIKDISLTTIPEDFRDKKIHACYEICHKE